MGRYGDSTFEDGFDFDVPEDFEPPPPHVLGERLELRAFHSCGGSGEVWRVHDTALGRDLALKRLRPELRDIPVFRARMEREARITASLDHPGVVPVFDIRIGKPGEDCFYTMRILEGRLLSEAVFELHDGREVENRPLVTPAFFALLRDYLRVCETLTYAHSRGVIHRDVKAENVLLGRFGEVTVLDWGLAKYTRTSGLRDQGSIERAPTAPHVTVDGRIMGTPCYMAPEQALGLNDELDERTDVYGLAALLYELLTGVPPFAGEYTDVVLRQVVEDAPHHPAEIVPDVPRELAELAMSGLAKSPRDRPQSTDAITSCVESWLDGETAARRRAAARANFFRLSDDYLCLLDEAGRIEEINPAWHTRLGRTPADYVGAPFVALLDEADRRATERVLDRVRETRRPLLLETQMKTVLGDRHWVQWQVNEGTSHDDLYLVGRDVTSHHLVQEELQALLESGPDPLCVIVEHGAIARVNARLLELLGYERDELVGANLAVLVPEQNRVRHARLVAEYLDAPVPRPMGTRVFPVRRKDGTQILVDITLSPVETSQRRLVVCALRPAGARPRS